MAKASHALQKVAVVQHRAGAHILKDRLPEGNMESLATNIRLATPNCWSLSSELQQAALSRLLRYPHSPFADIEEAHIRDYFLISIDNYTIYRGDADERKVRSCAIAVRNNYNDLVEEFRSTSPLCAFARLRLLISKIQSQQAVFVGIDANVKMGLEQQSDALGKWLYLMEQTSDNGNCLINTCEQTNLIIASTFKRNHQRHHVTWH
ncbi:hypothetical protein RB195_025029 [Necator americanus]|uniref:Uncharacterized protein n=1 Tax=Necator americanus TaxID=51031 RepID=A0ABR1EQL5_NECAM